MDGITPQNIFVAGTDKNSGEIELTTDNLSSRPVWSPDGTKIAFVRGGKSGGIFVMDADGTNARRITTGDYWLGTLTWSPNGKRLAYDVRIAGNFNGQLSPLERPIYVADMVSDAPPRLLLSNGSSPSWSPDGTQIAYTCVRRTGSREWTLSICTISANANSDARLLIDRARNPLWSPDGAQILYISIAEPKPHLFVAQVDGSNSRRLSDKSHDVISASWSPNGKYIAFTSNRVMDNGFATTAHFEGPDSGMFQGEPGGIDPAITQGVQSNSVARSQRLPELFVTNADGSGLVHIAPKQNVWCDQFSWSPDSSSIAGICGSGPANPSGYRWRLATDSIFVLSVIHPHSKPRVIAQSGIENISAAPSAPQK